jgi:hypothetical protein
MDFGLETRVNAGATVGASYQPVRSPFVVTDDASLLHLAPKKAQFVASCRWAVITNIYTSCH